MKAKAHTMKTHRNNRVMAAALAIVAATSLVAASCSSDGEDASESSTTEQEATTTTQPEAAEPASLDPSGPGCTAVPEDGEGSFDGMADDPAATAASNNPALSTLVTAVGQADLVDTLNGDGPFTIFAPANSAFEAIPAETLNAVMADTATLTDILTYHVIAGEMLSSQDLVDMGSATTVEGADLTFAEDGGTIMVNDATVVCMDVPTANATVHIIDSVLMPGA